MISVHVILAFGFSSPALLGGLLLAGIPVLIHLLHRRRHVEHRWAAMQFLVAAMKRESRRVRLQNFVLLLLRTLILAGLVLAFARPFIDADDGLLNSQQPVHRILVIDTSFSMQRDESADVWSVEADGQSPPGTRFARAQQILRELLDAGRRGDAWNLVRIAGPGPLAIVGQASFRPESVRDEVDRLKASDGRGNLLRTLTSVLELTGQVPELSRKEVIVVSDLQAPLWSPADGPAQEKLSALMEQIAERARLSVISVGGAAANAAVISLNAGHTPVISGRPVDISCAIHSFGSSVLRDQIVELLIDGRIVDTRRVDLSPGVDVPVEFSPVLRETGRHIVEVRLEADALPVDNRRWQIIEVQDELRVLLVDGRPAGRPRDRASFYLERALAPQTRRGSTTAADGAASPIRPHVVTEGELPSVILDDYDVVVLCDAGLLTEREAALLDTYVRGGGGLVIFPGQRTHPDSLNSRLFQNGEGILPARIGERITVPSGGTVLTFDARGFTHPLVAAFRGNPDAGLESTMTVSFLKLQPADAASTALWFSDGSPALVERRAGDGRVVLAATGADDRWGTWAIWAPSFVPMMHETVRFAASGRWQNPGSLVGDAVTLKLDRRMTGESATIRQPDESTVEIPIRDPATGSSRFATAVFDRTDQAGVYTTVPDMSSTRALAGTSFVVNVDPSESDLTPIDPARLTSDLYPNLLLRTADRSAGEQSAAPASAAGTVATLSRLLAWIVLLGLLAEPFLAWRFSTGVFVAAGLAIAATALQFGLVHATALSIICAAVWWLIHQRRLETSNQNISTHR